MDDLSQYAINYNITNEESIEIYIINSVMNLDLCSRANFRIVIKAKEPYDVISFYKFNEPDLYEGSLR